MTDRPVIGGVALEGLKQISDDRGVVLRMLRSDEPGFEGFGECYFSEINPGVVKAWKRHRRQSQNLAVPVGRVVVAVFDDRPLSATMGSIEVYKLGRPDDYFRLCLPPGIWYGFKCLGSSPALIANCTDLLHDPSESEEVPFDHPSIPYRWFEDGA